jgi:hypothetical protein
MSQYFKPIGPTVADMQRANDVANDIDWPQEQGDPSGIEPKKKPKPGKSGNQRSPFGPGA